MDIDKLFEFEECDNGYLLRSYLLKDEASVTEVEIPSEHNGQPVVSIGFEAFSYAIHLCSVKLSEGIEEIGIKAFYSCFNLKTVLLPDSLKAIQRFSFNNCRNLENIVFPNKLEVIDEYSFFSCKSIKSVNFPSSLRELGKAAFCDCAGLEYAVLPKELENIGDFAFQDCVSLNSVILPEKLKAVSVHLFKNCQKLESITFPDGLKEIGSYAFDLSGLRWVRLPAGLERIGDLAFFFCLDLEKVEFQSGGTLLGTRVFEDCPKLSAENVIQGLAGSSDVTKAFTDSEEFDWNSAFRKDVFALALKYDSFVLFDKGRVLREIVKRNLIQFLPLTENAGWSITEECMGELLDISAQKGFVEITAWLLDYKNRKIGFGKA